MTAKGKFDISMQKEFQMSQFLLKKMPHISTLTWDLRKGTLDQTYIRLTACMLWLPILSSALHFENAATMGSKSVCSGII